MTAQLDVLAFDGEPFDALAWSAPAEPATPEAPARSTVAPAPAAPAPSAAAPAVRAARTAAGDPVARLIQEVRADLVAAHASAMAVQAGLQRRLLAMRVRPESVLPASPALPTAHRAGALPAAETPSVDTRSSAVPAGVCTVPVEYTVDGGISVPANEVRSGAQPSDVPAPATSVSAFKPLALATVRTLDAAALAALTRGDIAAVFGPAYEQEGVNPEIRLTAGKHGALTEVSEIARHDGPWRRGVLRAGYRLDAPGGSADLLAGLVEASWQATQVFAMQVGLHLCLADTGFEVGNDGRCVVEVHDAAATGTGELVLDVVQIDLLPRPWLRVNAELRRAGAVVAEVRDLTLVIRERPGVPVGPEVGGVVPRFFGRRNVFGDHALLNEFHMTHSARGDLGIALGPEFAPYLNRRATRMPNHGLQLCDRVMTVQGERGTLTGGGSDTEYDSPADSWYYAETANASMPNVVYMETSLQSALLLGYFLGATQTAPEEDYSLRNLDGHATVLREVDLRDKTIQQTSRLLTTTVLVGAVLQSFSYELSVDGEPFYAGESLFGFFNGPALANQNGLDNGAYVPPWLDSQAERPAVRTIDVATRRASGAGIKASHGHLALVDAVEVVDGGGQHGRGYLRAVRPVHADDWFFQYHFHLDPVMPGSLGVEAVLQAMQEWAVDAGLGADLVDPEFVLPTGIATSWRYRGQILADDGEMTLEVHIKDVERRDNRVRVIGDASVWKPGMRIYELLDVAIELRGAGAEAW